MDISPRSTLKSCGSSSSENRRRILPKGVARSSPARDHRAALALDVNGIERNLSIRKRLPFHVTRSCR